MKKKLPLLIAPLFAAIIIISIFLFSGALCPDENGYLLKYQAQRFKVGSGNANFFDDSINYSDKLKYDAEKTFLDESIHKLEFYKAYSGGYVLGAMSRFMSERNAWKLMSFLSVLLSAIILFAILNQTTSKVKAFLFLTLFLVYPSIIEAYFKMNQCIISMLLVSLLLFVYFMKTEFLLRWYLLSLITAFLYVDNHFYSVIFYIIPCLAYLETKSESTSAKAVARAAGLLAFGIAMNIFCAHFYSDGENIFASISLKGLLDAVKSPLTFAIVINVIGIFKCPKYTKKYIYPSFVFYFVFIISALFSQAFKACETAVLPAIFIGFATCIIHQKVFRRFFGIAVVLVWIITVWLGVANVNSAVNFSNDAKRILSEEINAEDQIDKVIPTEKTVYLEEGNIKEIYLLIPRNVAVLKKIPQDAEFIVSQKENIENYQLGGKIKIDNTEKSIFVKMEE